MCGPNRVSSPPMIGGRVHREAFEDWVDDKFGGPAGRHTSRCEGVYLNDSVQAAWVGWQAAKAHYAPKLTEAQAIEIAAKAMADLMNQGAGFDGLPEFCQEGWR